MRKRYISHIQVFIVILCFKVLTSKLMQNLTLLEMKRYFEENIKNTGLIIVLILKFIIIIACSILVLSFIYSHVYKNQFLDKGKSKFLIIVKKFWLKFFLVVALMVLLSIAIDKMVLSINTRTPGEHYLIVFLSISLKWFLLFSGTNFIMRPYIKKYYKYCISGKKYFLEIILIFVLVIIFSRLIPYLVFRFVNSTIFKYYFFYLLDGVFDKAIESVYIYSIFMLTVWVQDCRVAFKKSIGG